MSKKINFNHIEEYDEKETFVKIKKHSKDPSKKRVRKDKYKKVERES